MTTAPLVDFLRACAVEIEARAQQATSRRGSLIDGSHAFTTALEQSAPIAYEPSTVPVVSCLGDIEPSPLVDLFRAAQGNVRWVPSFRADDGGTETALAPLNDVLDFGSVICGLLAVGPRHRYPLHSHPPQELYLPLTSGGTWRFGGSESHRELADGELVYNRPNDLHEVIAAATPLLALYVLW